MAEVTQAFVLAAGLGQRMRPLTDSRPKALVALAGRPLIDHALDRLAEAGVATAVVNVHHRADMLGDHLKHRTMPAVVISDERAALLDTGGGAVRALGRLGPGPFFTVNSDAVWIEGVAPTLDRLAGAFDPARMDVLLLVAATVHAVGFNGAGDFLMDEEGRLARRGERPAVPFVYAGVSVVAPTIFEGAPEGAFSMNLLWDRAIEAGRAFGLRHDGIWMHVGTPDALAAAEAVISGRVVP
jgi:MurNAc alpha-1-phosphate uridylyltransferase